MTDIKVGDRVKVTFESEVSQVDGLGFEVTIDPEGPLPLYHWFGPRFVNATNLSVEKIEPPVEVFKPGDVVRARDARDYIYGLTQDGYVYLAPVNLGLHVPYGTSAFQKDEFTSRKYERVSL